MRFDDAAISNPIKPRNRLNVMREWLVRVTIFFGIIELTAILHDQFSVHIAPGYWRPPHHPLLFGEQSPIVLGFLWGIAASWWFALPAALLLGKTTMTAWSRRKAVRTLAFTCGGILVGVLIFWVGTYCFLMYAGLAKQPTHDEAALLATKVMHLASYACSFIAILVLAVFSLVAHPQPVSAGS